MRKKEVISKVMEEYSRYGLPRIAAEILYILAILWRVPKDTIYPGMRMTLNNTYGLHDDVAVNEVGIALVNSAIDETKKEYGNASNKDIAEAIEMMEINSFEENIGDKNFPLSNKIKEAIRDHTKKFVKRNKKRE